MPPHPDVLIIGGGVIGLTAAYYLAREGVRVRVVDQGDLGQEASWAGAGILPPGNADRAATAYEKLRAVGVSLYPDLSAELRERTGIDNGFLRCGGIEFLQAGEHPVVEEWRREGIAFEKLDEPGLHRLEPALGAATVRERAVGTAYLLPDLAQVRNPRHLKALLAGCAARGVELQAGCPVLGFERQGERVTAARIGSGSLPAGRFLIAAGAWSDALLADIGWRPGIRPVRGQIALLNTGTPLLRRVLMIGPRYLVPRADGRVLAGSTEEDAGFEKRTTAGAIRDLLEMAVGLVPALAGAHLERSWAGLRPGSPDGLPFIGPVPGIANLHVAAGHFRAGIQLAPGTALVLKELLLGRPLTVPLEAFRLDRPPASPRMLFRS